MAVRVLTVDMHPCADRHEMLGRCTDVCLGRTATRPLAAGGIDPRVETGQGMAGYTTCMMDACRRCEARADVCVTARAAPLKRPWP